MDQPRDLTIVQAAREMRAGELTAEALVLSCLERIETREPEIQAWVYVDREHALRTAREMDEDAKEGRWRGPLHGIPLGLKDIIDVQGMETRGGTEAYPARTAQRDAGCVARLREAGSIMLGKTQTTAFAFYDPAVTRNPWNPAHTPGGSSAGSGAAVGDRMCMAALGSQTAGSALRPAAFNGLVGFKAGIGKIPTDGIIPLSVHMDHVAPLTRGVEDAHLLWSVLREDAVTDWRAAPDNLPPPLQPAAPRRVWRVRDMFEQESSPECLENLEHACGLLRENGVEIVEMALPAGFATVREAHWAILSAEAGSVHEKVFADREALFPKHLAEFMREAVNTRAVDYINAMHHRDLMRGEIAALLEGVDAAIMPTSVTPPPEGLSATGSAAFNIPWSICGIPAMSLPTRIIEGNLPLGVQLIAAQDKEDALLQYAAWCEEVFAFRGAPA